MAALPIVTASLAGLSLSAGADGDALNGTGGRTTTNGDDGGDHAAAAAAGRADAHMSGEDHPAGSEWPSDVTSMTTADIGVSSTAPSSLQKRVVRRTRDAGARTEPYEKKRKKIPGPGQYLLSQISNKLKCSSYHSFLVARKPLPLMSDKEWASLPLAARTPVYVLRAAINYAGNPSAPSSTTRVIWTKHEVETIQKDVGSVIPMFSQLLRKGSRSRNGLYTFEGHFRVEKTELATPKEVTAFVNAWHQSKPEQTERNRRKKSKGQWLRVTLERAPEEEQPGNPMDVPSEPQVDLPMPTDEEDLTAYDYDYDCDMNNDTMNEIAWYGYEEY